LLPFPVLPLFPPLCPASPSLFLGGHRLRFFPQLSAITHPDFSKSFVSPPRFGEHEESLFPLPVQLVSAFPRLSNFVRVDEDHLPPESRFIAGQPTIGEERRLNRVNGCLSFLYGRSSLMWFHPSFWVFFAIIRISPTDIIPELFLPSLLPF